MQHSLLRIFVNNETIGILIAYPKYHEFPEISSKNLHS